MNRPSTGIDRREKAPVPTNTELADQLLAKIRQTKYHNDRAVLALLTEARRQAIAWFGEKNAYLAKLDEIDEVRRTAYNRMSADWQTMERLPPLVEAMRDSLAEASPGDPGEDQPATEQHNPRIFLAYGRDEEMASAVLRVLKPLGLEAAILGRSPGRTVVEQVAHDPAVRYAIVLLSPDEMICAPGDAAQNARPQAGQRVIFELGYLLGVLGSRRVFVVYRAAKGFQPAADTGMACTPFDAAGHWQSELARELRASGFEVESKGQPASRDSASG
jgi:predicted nucleotide-binding protein